jgi:hypothetical protein
MWAQTGPTIINEGPDWWVTVMASALPAAAAVGAVWVQGQRQRDAEHDRFLLTERFHSYATLLSAIDEAADAGVAAAVWATSPDRTEGSAAHLNALMEELGNADIVRRGVAAEPEVERWHRARTALQRAAADTHLRAADQHRHTLDGLLRDIEHDLPSPLDQPEQWLADADWEADARDEPAPAERCLATYRSVVDALGRTEARITPRTWRNGLRRRHRVRQLRLPLEPGS